MMLQPLPFMPQPSSSKVPRYYQEEAVDAIWRVFEEQNSALLVLATGLGKTACFSWVAKQARAKGWNILCLAHTGELVEQNRKTLEEVLGETVYVEQAELQAPPYAGLVSGSFQSITQERRLQRLGRNRFQLVIADEAHRSLAPSFLKVLDYFQAKRLGVTATPDRGDERALGRVYDEVAYVMDIVDGIDAGFLVPLDARNVQVQELDISKVREHAGKLNEGELDKAVLEGVEGIVKETLRLEPDRYGVMFWPGVLSAEAAHHLFEELQPGSSCFLHGGTDPDERRQIVRDFKAKKYRYMNQCLVAIEGFDAPHVDLIGWARPCKSRWMFAQAVGRGMRTMPGTVDDLPGEHEAAARKLRIAMSAKPNAVLLNFVGNAGAHNLVTPEDILGGDFSEPELKEAQRLIKESQQGDETYDPLEALKASRQWLQQLAKQATTQFTAVVTAFDPFKLLDVDLGEDRIGQRYGVHPPTEKQIVMLKGRGVEDDLIRTLDRRGASKLIDSLKQRQAAGLASLKQMRFLAKYGVTDNTVTFEAANKGITYIKGKGWGKHGIDPSVLNQLLGRE